MKLKEIPSDEAASRNGDETITRAAVSGTRNAQRPVRVLLVEDNPGDALVIAEMLSEYRGQFCLSSQVRHVAEAEQVVESGAVDLVLLDVSLPDSHGFETFERLLSCGGNLPILILSGVTDESLALRMVRAGAQDHLVKHQFDGALLSRAMRYAIGRKQADHDAQRLLSAVIEEKERLTSLLNSISDEVWFADTDRKFTLANPAALREFRLGSLEKLDVRGACVEPRGISWRRESPARGGGAPAASPGR